MTTTIKHLNVGDKFTYQGNKYIVSQKSQQDAFCIDLNANVPCLCEPNKVLHNSTEVALIQANKTLTAHIQKGKKSSENYFSDCEDQEQAIETLKELQNKGYTIKGAWLDGIFIEDFFKVQIKDLKKGDKFRFNNIGQTVIQRYYDWKRNGEPYMKTLTERAEFETYYFDELEVTKILEK